MSLRAGEAVLLIEETLTNEGAEPMAYMWGHHPAFGAPFLSSDCRIDLPHGELIVETMEDAAGTRLMGGGRHAWPYVADGEADPIDFSCPDPAGSGHEDLGYVTNLPEGWYAITNQAQQVGFALTWSLDRFPYLWVWRQFNQSGGYPWYGQVYTMALEPWSSYPSAGLPTAIENGTAGQIAPGESQAAALRAVAYQGLEQVSQVTPAGEIRGK
jgi:hypothetical protein